MGTFAVDAVVTEIETRLKDQMKRAGAGFKDADGDKEFVELLATVELINRYSASELLSGGQPPKAGTPTATVSANVIDHLKDWILKIREIVLKVARALHAKAWSVGVQFPWGILLSLEFEIPKP